MQQKLHRERLEELNRVKLENQSFNHLAYMDQLAMQQLQMIHSNAMFQPTLQLAQQHCCTSVPEVSAKSDHSTPNKNELDLDNLAALVYKKLKLKKHLEKSLNTSSGSIPKTKNKRNSKRADDDYLIDLIIEQHNDSFRSTKSVSLNKMDKTGRSSPARTGAVSTTVYESDKLIEELFFLK